MQRLMVSSQHGNLDDSSRAELPDMNSISVDHHLEGRNLTSNGLASPGLQSVLSAGSEATETYHTTKAHNSTEKAMGSPSIIRDNEQVAHAASERKKPKPWLFFIVGAIACLIIGLAVGLGVGLTRKGPTRTTSSQTTPSSGGTSPTPNSLSTVGAFNGTGIALASKSTGLDFASLEFSGYGDFKNIVMYFQLDTGEIREMQLLENESTDKNEWVGGNSSDLVVEAKDAKPGTPISAVSYVLNKTAAWHIFYISADNTVQEMKNSNTTNNWVQGPINKLNLKTTDDPNVGLQACSNVALYDSSDQTIGINLWYAQDSITFGSASWQASNNTWMQEDNFTDYNGHGGVACYSQYSEYSPLFQGPIQEGGNYTYVMFVNLQNELNILWKDVGTTSLSTDTHPVGVWTKSSVSIPVFTNTSIEYAGYPTEEFFLFAQNSNFSISGWYINYDAENTSIQPTQSFTINTASGANGIPGTHLTSFMNAEGLLEAFYQTNDTNIEQLTSSLNGDGWHMDPVPIPAS